MNIAITNGLTLNPPAFSAGLSVWSRENGTPGSATWAGMPNAALIAADSDFGRCLEITKVDDTTRLRFMGETPILPGTYLRISARLKVVAGMLPQARIAGFAGTASRTNVPNVVQVGPTTSFGTYGSVIEISAIVGVGSRTGVTMPWGPQAVYGHFGLDLIGPNGGSVRIESIRIDDVTSAFVPSMLDWVDVRDFGAKGDGVTDDRAAFLAADAAANGGEVVVPEGTFFIGSDLAMNAPMRFKGRLVMPVAARLGLNGRFDFATYADAFGSETEGLKRAIQALLGFTDHGTLSLNGRRVDLTEPLDLAKFCPTLRSYSNRRVIANGQIVAVAGPAWDSRTVTSQAVYAISQPTTLSNVANVANIEVGSRVSGAGVGREVYVNAVNVGAGTVTISQALYSGSGTKDLTFTRDRYLFDFSGMEKLDRFNFADIDFLCEGIASGVMLPPSGEVFQMRDCWMTRPKDRGITSIGRGCQGMLIERCHFLSNELGALAQDRRTVCINTNANDTKIRDNRFVRFQHFMVTGGGGHIISGNHWFQGDSAPSGQGLRTAGLVLGGVNLQTTISGNYVDNATIEWTNEYQASPDFLVAPQFSFGGLTITGNTMRCSGTTPWFSFLVLRPFGPNHFIHGLIVQGNVFKSEPTRITRVDRVDTSIADVDYVRMRNIQFEGNTFTGVDRFVSNPLRVPCTQGTASGSWLVSAAEVLPFQGIARSVESIIATTAITDANGARVTDMPYIAVRQGADQRSIAVNWSRAAKGSVAIWVRMDTED